MKRMIGTLFTVVLISGCVSLDVAAPLPGTLGAAGARADVIQGRALYVGKCAKCHSAEPVRNYSLSRWDREILPDMAEEANCSAEETRCLRAYIHAVLTTPPTPRP